MMKSTEKNELVTKGFLKETLDERLSAFKVDLIKEVRVMLHDALLESLENAKAYHEKETKKYIKILMDERKDEMKVFYDYMKGIKDTQEVHEDRISSLESATA